jgi:hypothetical protein
MNTLTCHDIVNRLGSHDVHTHNVRSPSESNWPDDGSIGIESCCHLYLNKLYVSDISILLYYIKLNIEFFCTCIDYNQIEPEIKSTVAVPPGTCIVEQTVT